MLVILRAVTASSVIGKLVWIVKGHILADKCVYFLNQTSNPIISSTSLGTIYEDWVTTAISKGIYNKFMFDWNEVRQNEQLDFSLFSPHFFETVDECTGDYKMATHTGGWNNCHNHWMYVGRDTSNRETRSYVVNTIYYWSVNSDCESVLFHIATTSTFHGELPSSGNIFQSCFLFDKFVNINRLPFSWCSNRFYSWSRLKITAGWVLLALRNAGHDCFTK